MKRTGVLQPNSDPIREMGQYRLEQEIRRKFVKTWLIPAIVLTFTLGALVFAARLAAGY